MSLTSSSTLSEVIASYMDNGSFEEDGNATKARAFVTACKFLVILLPKSAAIGGGERGGGHTMELEPSLVQEEAAAAKAWLAANATTTAAGNTRTLASYADFTDFRN